MGGDENGEKGEPESHLGGRTDSLDSGDREEGRGEGGPATSAV